MYQILQKFDIHWHDGGPSIAMMYHLRRVSDLLCNWKSCLLCYMKDVVLHCSIFFKWNKLVRVRVRVQITSFTIVYSALYSGADQRKHQSSASPAFVRGIHRGPVNSPHKCPVTRKMFPFHDVIMIPLSRGTEQFHFNQKGTNAYVVVICSANWKSFNQRLQRLNPSLVESFPGGI